MKTVKIHHYSSSFSLQEVNIQFHLPNGLRFVYLRGQNSSCKRRSIFYILGDQVGTCLYLLDCQNCFKTDIGSVITVLCKLGNAMLSFYKAGPGNDFCICSSHIS
jgi:hypothetical protein